MGSLIWVITTLLFVFAEKDFAVRSAGSACESVESGPLQASSSVRYESQDADAERGCCLWRTAEVSCAYANRGYCRTKAEQLGVTYQFFEGRSCREVGECPSSGLLE